MIKQLFAALAVSLTALTVLPPDPAEARRGIRSGAIRGPAVRARVIGVRPVIVRRPIRVYRPVRIVRGGPVFVAGVGRCEWLRRRAIITGSPYWWRRYRICRLGY